MHRRIIALIVIALLSLATFGIASAHAELASSDPAAGAKLTAAPAKVTLVFDEEISEKPAESFFTVKDASGAEVGRGTLDNTDIDHKTLSGALKTGLADGVYTVAWQATTPDDNGKSEGSFTFGVNADPGAQPTEAPHNDAPAATAAPTAAAAQPTAAARPTPAPAALPNTGANESGLFGLFLAVAVLLVAGGLALSRRGAR